MAGDITDRLLLDALFAHRKLEVVSLHAAKKNIRVSVSDTALDATINIFGILVLLQQSV